MGYESRYVYCIFQEDEDYLISVNKIYANEEDAKLECQSMNEGSVDRSMYFYVEKRELR